MLTNLFTGLSSWGSGLRYVSRYNLWGYILLPGLISLAMGGLLLLLGWNLSAEVGVWLQGLYPDSWWGKDVIDDAAGILAFLLTALLLIFVFKYLVMIAVAPFLGPVSEKVESLVTGTPAPPFSLKNMARDTFRAIRVAIRNVVRELVYTLMLLLLQLIPVVGTLISTVLIFLVQSYYAGFGNMDPTLERRPMNIRERVQFVKANRALAIGNGSLFVLLMFVPVIGWFLAPAIGTIGATHMTLKRLERQ